MARELLRLGLIAQATGDFKVLELTEKGKAILTQRQTIHLIARPAIQVETKKHAPLKESADSTLFDQLRQLRKQLAEERGVPAFVIFHDSVLKQIARDLPTTLNDFSRIKGVGQKKLEQFGESFVKIVVDHRKRV